MTLKEGQSLSLMFPRTRRLSHPQPTLLISLHAWQHQASERLNFTGRGYVGVWSIKGQHLDRRGHWLPSHIFITFRMGVGEK